MSLNRRKIAIIGAAGPLPDMKAGQNDRQQTLGATVEILKDIVPKIKVRDFDGMSEHGETQFVPWSLVTVAGKPLLELIKEQTERFEKLDLEEIALRAKKAGWIILGGKGSTKFGIGASIANVVKAIFGDENRILPVSTLLTGQYGYKDVFASVPCRLNNEGVAEVIELNLTDEEKAKFDESVKSMTENYRRALGM